MYLRSVGTPTFLPFTPGHPPPVSDQSTYRHPYPEGTTRVHGVGLCLCRCRVPGDPTHSAITLLPSPTTARLASVVGYRCHRQCRRVTTCTARLPGPPVGRTFPVARLVCPGRVERTVGDTRGRVTTWSGPTVSRLTPPLSLTVPPTLW